MRASGGRGVIWVVDDSRLDAERARRVLSTEHDVRVFVDGSAALEALSSDARPDVLVLDWVMPGISGLEVCRFLRSGTIHADDIAILLLTAHRQTEQIVEGLEAGANDYLAKPYADEELRARVSALLRSLSLLRRAERAESANRRLLESTPDPLIVIDKTQHVVFANDVAALAFDRSSESLVGLPLETLLPQLDHNMKAPLETIQMQLDVELSGRVFSASLRAMAGQEDAGRTSILLRDVTERRLVDARRLDLYSMIAHDLRTPLNSILLRLGLMQGDQLVVGSPNLSKGVAQINRNINSLVEMINDFLELARLDSHGHRLERGEVDLLGLLTKAAEDLGPLIEAKGHDWSIRCDTPDSVVVNGDGRRLHQAVTNLIANAIKFTPDGGTLYAQVDVSETHVRIGVCDNGRGVDPDVAKTLFQRYRRVDSKVSGTGLGLLIVREIAEAHGGTVGVESQLGKGACFWMRLPRSSGRGSAP